MPTRNFEKNCESCLMPFSKDPGKRENNKYCSLCFKHGKLCYEGHDLKEFKKVCYESMRKQGMGVLKASFLTSMVGFAPRWKETSKS